MQVTGSKIEKNRNSRLSIRIPSGQSLHCDSPSVGESTAAIDLWVEGAVVVPFPTALSGEIDTLALMTTAGVSVDNDERVLVTNGEEGISYALRLSAESALTIEEWIQGGKSVKLLSPLMTCVARAIAGCWRKKLVALTLLDGTAYIAYTHKRQLQYAEALPVESEEELITLLAHLNQDFALRKARFVLLGKESKAYYKTLRKYFSRVRCEE